MKRLLRKIFFFLSLFGIDLQRMLFSVKGSIFYARDLWYIKKQHNFNKKKDFRFGKIYPCLVDKYLENGSTSGHYFHQDLLIAQRIFLNKPKHHVDIGSRIDGLVAHIASYRYIEVFDIRPQLRTIANIKFNTVDFMIPLDMHLKDYCDSISSLHVIEHFGLGRYGDKLDYYGHIQGLNNLHYMLQEKGILYLSVPIGTQRIEFNAHRVFSMSYLLLLFEGKYNIIQFSYIDDTGNLHQNVQLNESAIENNFNCNYGCGIFELQKT